jgi:cellulose synthase/poly-beta-1,6-N-acetylglucosamine synthase-like glycosyltransferase
MASQNNFIASVIVPAHNEAAVIGRLLGGLEPAIAAGRLDVVVACNGCTDATAEIARRHGARVVETDVSSKIAALNAGDEAALAFPRIYVDADVAVTEDVIKDLARALSGSEVQCASPPFTVDLQGRPWLVRAYYAIWLRDPYLRDAYVGSGIYGVSRAGRAKFVRFPNVIADDRFIRDVYRRSERSVVATSPFSIQAPRTLRSLFRRRVRICRGNLEIARHPELGTLPGSAERSTPWWTSVLKNPLLLPCAAVYVAVNGLARLAALRQVRNKARMDWARDETIRA